MGSVCVRHSVGLMGKGRLKTGTKYRDRSHVYVVAGMRPPCAACELLKASSCWVQRPPPLSPHLPRVHRKHFGRINSQRIGIGGREWELAKGASKLNQSKRDQEIQKQWGQDNQRQLLRALSWVWWCWWRGSRANHQFTFPVCLVMFTESRSLPSDSLYCKQRKTNNLALFLVLKSVFESSLTA